MISNRLLDLDVTPDPETLQKALDLLPHNPDMNICQRIGWIKHQNIVLYKQTKEPIYLAMILYSSEAHEMAKKMNDKLVEYYEKNVQV